MGDLNLTILAAEEGGGQSNFLIPNGTFFVVLLIFLIVLGVIAKWVVPPISKVLHEREAMVQKTAEDNRRTAQLRAAADADYRKVDGRRAPRSHEHPRRGPRRRPQDRRRRAGPGQRRGLIVQQQTTEELTRAGAAVTAELQSSVETLAATLASRVLGVDVTTRTVSGHIQGRGGSCSVNLHRTARRLRGHRLPAVEIRRAAGSQHDEQPAGDRPHPARRTTQRRSRSSPTPTPSTPRLWRRPRPRRRR